MTVISDLLYVGTRGGVLLAFNCSSMHLQFTSYAYNGPVRCLLELPKPQASGIPQSFLHIASNMSGISYNTGSSGVNSDKSICHKDEMPHSSLDRSRNHAPSLFSQPSSSKGSVLLSIGYRYRGVVDESENCPPAFILPSDGKQTRTKPSKPNPQGSSMLLWSTTHHNIQ